MNCCDDYGNCTRSKDCPARPAMLDLADRARHMAAEVFYEPDYNRAAPVNQPQISFPDVRAWLGDMLYAAVPVLAFVGAAALFVGFVAAQLGWI
jgi:hypothetical protein